MPPRAACSAASLAGVSGRSSSATRAHPRPRSPAHRRAHAIALADAFGAERRERATATLEMQDQRRGHFGRGRHQIVGERAGDEIAVVGIDVFLVERGAERVRETAGDLTRHHAGMQHTPAVVHRHVLVDAHRASDAIDLEPAEIENEAVAERGVDAVVFGRRGQLRRRPEHGLAQRLIVFAKRSGCPVCGRGDAAERQRVVRVAPRAHTPLREFDLVGLHVELRRRRARELARACARPQAARRRTPPGRNGSHSCRWRSTRRRARCPSRCSREYPRASGRAHRQPPATRPCDGLVPAEPTTHAPKRRRPDRARWWRLPARRFWGRPCGAPRVSARS